MISNQKGERTLWTATTPLNLNIQIKVIYMMTYIVKKPAVSFTGIERPLITIEFAPDIHPTETEYSYPHPQFVFGDRVTIANTYPELEFTVCALELVESKTQSGKLLI